MEIWRDIKGHPGYQVSDAGNVRSFINNRHGVGESSHILKPVFNHHGYPTVCLGRNNRKLVSRLVATAFLPNPTQLPLVRHKDDDPKNNHVSNLVWGTQKDNMQDCVRRGRLVGNIQPAIDSTKRPIIAIAKDGSACMEFDSIHDAARELNVWPQHICSVLQGKISQTGGWKFVDAERGVDNE